MDTITFLTEPLDSINREARIQRTGEGWHIVNLNMPYLGTLNEWWTNGYLEEKIREGEVQLNKEKT